MSDDPQNDLKAALQTFARERIDALAKKTIARLRRSPDPGAHPYGWDMKTLWSLYSWDVQHGPINASELLGDLVNDAAFIVVNALPDGEAVLLTVAVSEEDLPPNSRADFEIVRAVVERVSDIASSRDLERYDPDYRWYENI